MAAAQSREVKLAKRALDAGYRLEGTKEGYRLVHANGTLAAAAWSAPDGYGLTLDEIEIALS